MTKHGQLLHEIHAKGIDHGAEGDLVDHLVATEQILRTWRCSEPICTAGLFHSAYGTDHLPESALDRGSRARLSKAIGKMAEELVWLFCSMERKSLVKNQVGAASPCIRERDSGKVIGLTPDTCASLVHIFAANALEQLPRRQGEQHAHYRDEAYAQLTAARPWLNERARLAVDRWV